MCTALGHELKFLYAIQSVGQYSLGLKGKIRNPGRRSWMCCRYGRAKSVFNLGKKTCEACVWSFEVLIDIVIVKACFLGNDFECLSMNSNEFLSNI